MMGVVLISREDARIHLSPYFSQSEARPLLFSCWEIECIPVVNLSRTLAYPIRSDPTVTAQAGCQHLYSSRLSLCQDGLCGGREGLRSAPKKKKNTKITLEEPLHPVDNGSFRPLSRPVRPLIPIQEGDV